jgi:biofilm PGA synthesis N-glycosyltransferase PgaC
MPETVNGLWKQRSRWAQGGVEVMMRYFSSMFNRRALAMWPLYLECCISLLWSFTVVFLIVLAPFLLLLGGHKETLDDLSPHWTSMLLCITCLLQFAVSLGIDAHYERRTGEKYYYWMIWYPIVYWLINIGTAVNGFIKALKKTRGQRAVWVTVDRGLKGK